MDEVAEGREFVQWGDAKLSVRSYLKRFLFADERILTQVKKLSGGERSRLLLARILKSGGNFLILDEPTNDLDLPTLRVLEEALIAFPGVTCVVSHDRYFLNRVCTDILAFEGDGKIHHSVGDYDYYLEKKQKALAAATRQSAAILAINKSAARFRDTAPQKSKPRKLSFKETRELEGMEAQIQAVEAEIARIEGLVRLAGLSPHTRDANQTARRRPRHREGKVRETLRPLGGIGGDQGRGGRFIIAEGIHLGQAGGHVGSDRYSVAEQPDPKRCSNP